MRIIGWLGLAALAFTVGGAAQAETVKIGVVLPFSGANADLGHQIDKAFDLYVKLHAKDIAPYQVEIVKRDEGPPTGAGQAGRQVAGQRRLALALHGAGDHDDPAPLDAGIPEQPGRSRADHELLCKVLRRECLIEVQKALRRYDANARGS